VTVRDVETLELLRDQPELLAIADAVGSTQRRRKRLPRRVLLAAAAVLAAVVVALLAPWQNEGGRGLVPERALAALPAPAPVMHAVLEQRLGTRVHLQTGRLSPVLVRSESWYDQERALLRVRAYRDGRVLGDSTFRDAGDSSAAWMVLSFAQAAELFRQALADGRARVVGEARIRGHDVYLLAAEPKPNGFQGSMRTAIDKHTYELVQVRGGESFAGGPEYELNVLTFEYLPRREGLFGRPRPGSPDLESAGGVGDVLGPPTDLATARTALGGKVALWAGPELGGRAIGGVQLLDVEVDIDSAKGRGIRGQALELAYGAGGFGPRRRDSVVVTQIRADDPARSYFEEASRTPPGFADLRSGTAVSGQNRFRTWTASLRYGGFLVQIEGADRELVLRAARALRPIPAGAR
jgi:hypothetical protein